MQHAGGGVLGGLGIVGLAEYQNPMFEEERGSPCCGPFGYMTVQRDAAHQRKGPALP